MKINLCRIDMKLVIKVADFGLSVNTGTKEYYCSMNDMSVKLPFRWMAPECLTDHTFSESSDVVSLRLKYRFKIIMLVPSMRDYIIYDAVGLWNYMLGNLQWRPSALHWHQPHSNNDITSKWRSIGNTKQHCL